MKTSSKRPLEMIQHLMSETSGGGVDGITVAQR